MWLSSEYSIWPRATALLLLLPPPPGSKFDHLGPRRPALAQSTCDGGGREDNSTRGMYVGKEGKTRG